MGEIAHGILAAACRLWAKARRQQADAWEDKHFQGFCSAACENSPAETVWRQAARQEAAKANEEEAAAIVVDMASFCETIPREILLQEARATGFPTRILMASLDAYV